MTKTFYTTTPIYYTNGIPHIGHAYSSLICDILSTYHKINGYEVKFATGVDENSQKALEKAKEAGMEIMEYLDMMAAKHKAVWDGLGIGYTDFIRTTEKRHHTLVREVLQKCFDNGDIYQGLYEGLYCVGCEAFKKEDDLVVLEGKKVCPDHLKEPQVIKEKNWFFRLSKYQDFLQDFYEKHPNFVVPENRFNEVKAFVGRGLDDFSLSRETNTFGIKLPFDETQVTYVWFDALFNYITVCQSPDRGGDDMRFWPANVHVVAKDIIRFHAIFWPAMLQSAGYEMPKQILTTGYFTLDGQKISKSLGNAIDPVEFCEKYSKDLLTLYIMSAINIGQDGDFNTKDAIFQYNARLANNLGNLVNRVVVLSLKLKNESGRLFGTEKIKKTEEVQKLQREIGKYFETFAFKNILDATFSYLDTLNKFADETQPWQMIRDDTKLEDTREVLFIIAEGLRQAGLILYPFFPEKMSMMFEKLGLKNYKEILQNGGLKDLQEKKEIFEILEKGENLYNRIEIE